MSFTKIENNLMKAVLTPTEFTILANLMRYGSRDSFCFVRHKTLASDALMSVSTVKRVLASLQEKGYIQIETRKHIGWSNIYHLLYPKVVMPPANADTAPGKTTPAEPARPPVLPTKTKEAPACIIDQAQVNGTVAEQQSERVQPQQGKILPVQAIEVEAKMSPAQAQGSCGFERGVGRDELQYNKTVLIQRKTTTETEPKQSPKKSSGDVYCCCCKETSEKPVVDNGTPICPHCHDEKVLNLKTLPVSISFFLQLIRIFGGDKVFLALDVTKIQYPDPSAVRNYEGLLIHLLKSGIIVGDRYHQEKELRRRRLQLREQERHRLALRQEQEKEEDLQNKAIDQAYASLPPEEKSTLLDQARELVPEFIRSNLQVEIKAKWLLGERLAGREHSE